METKARLKSILAEEMNLPDLNLEGYDDDAPLFGDTLGLDSLDAVELVILIKKHFGLEIADMDEGKNAFSSMNTLAAYIDQRLPA
jgi:acyl carrier protein